MSNSSCELTSNRKNVSTNILLGVESLEDLEISDELLTCLFCSSTENVNNIVQCTCATCNDATDYDNHSSSDITDDEVDEYWEQIDIVDKKYSRHPKKKYPMPQWLKDKKHGDQKNEYNDSQTFLSPRDPKLKFDESTIEILEKYFITDRCIANYRSVVGNSKDYTLIHVNGGSYAYVIMPCNSAVKIYKLSKDPDENKDIFENARKEFDHLKLLCKARIKGWIPYCPFPINVWRNVIFLSQVDPATGVVVSKSSKDLDQSTYQEIISMMTVCYLNVGLVHGKLSPKKNIFINPLRFLDWGHSVKATHPQALELMMRDCQTITKFYQSRGAKVMKTEELFKHVTERETISKELIHLLKKMSPHPHIFYDSVNPNRLNKKLQPKNMRGRNRFKHAN